MIPDTNIHARIATVLRETIRLERCARLGWRGLLWRFYYALSCL